MEELLIGITKGLVDKPEAIVVTKDEPDEEGVIVYHLSVDESDIGRVIGKQGKIAKAIRVVLRTAAARQDMRVRLEIG